MGKLKHKIKSQLQHWGWFTQVAPNLKIQFFPTGKKLAQHLNQLDPKEAYSEFKRLTAFIADADNLAYYEDLLSHLYPNRNLIPEQSAFVSKGQRHNRNRIIRHKGQKLFEKNYDHNRFELTSITAFDRQLAELLSTAFRIPRLRESYTGSFSSLLYFDYLSLQALDTNHRDAVLIKMTDQLYQFSLENENRLQDLQLDPILLDYEKLFYAHHIARAHQVLKEHKIEAHKWQKRVTNSKRILTHGDLHIENVYTENTLIDLDNFGYYPIGLDAAFIYMFYFEERNHQSSVLEWGKKHFQTLIKDEDWPIFESNFMYYLFLFLHMRKDAADYPKMLGELVTYLKVHE